MNTLTHITLVGFIFFSVQGQSRTFKKHDTCVYGKVGHVKDLLYKIPKGQLRPTLQLARRRAQEKCQGVAITDRNPDNGISQCLFYSHIATKGRSKGKRVICINHACPGTKYEMDEPCQNFALKPAPKNRSENRRRRRNIKPKQFVVNKKRVYKVIEKCHYGKAGHVNAPLRSLKKSELKKKGNLVRRMAQEVCVSIDHLKDVPESGVHSCSFYSQIAKKGRYKGKRIICVNFSCTPTGYIMDGTCKNFKLR